MENNSDKSKKKKREKKFIPEEEMERVYDDSNRSEAINERK